MIRSLSWVWLAGLLFHLFLSLAAQSIPNIGLVSVERPDGEPHLCTTYYNLKVKEITYPSCATDVDCGSCELGGWWSRLWKCDSCCDHRVPVIKTVTKSIDVCCPGYYGLDCDQAFCSEPCTEPGTDCTAPNQCGPACYLSCENGAQCVTNGMQNVCLCAFGWTGAACDTPMQCSSSAENTTDLLCQNGGTCLRGRCHCPEKWSGVFCEKEVCSPPCRNGGVCKDGKCSCIRDYSGSKCEIPPKF